MDSESVFSSALEPSPAAPSAAISAAGSSRLESLDVLRGFALLGILLLNILGFGLLSAGYFNPEIGSGNGVAERWVNLGVWGLVDVFFEGAMRALFSMLFGAGVVLLTAMRARSVIVHYRRQFWLLLFGLIDAVLLLWSGDILVTYALAGMLLYPLRRTQPKSLLVGAGALVALLMLQGLAFNVSLAEGQAAAHRPDRALDARRADLAAGWLEFQADHAPEPAAVAAELAARGGSYGSAFSFNLETVADSLLFVIPGILFWDALSMMLLGMALFRLGVLDGSRSRRFYGGLAVGGFVSGLAINGLELWQAVGSGFDTLSTYSFLRWSYQPGRIAMALGYLGLVLWLCRTAALRSLRARLAAVGRMSLTNYLMHSLIALFLFTGAGLGLVGQLQRWQLYVVVFAIWLLQLILSPWWLAHYRYGPVEWLWRGLSYGSWPTLKIKEFNP